MATITPTNPKTAQQPPKEHAELESPQAAIFEQMFGNFGKENLPFAVQIPPNSILESGGQFLEYIPRKRLVQSFPAREKHANPLGNLQGGILSALIDDTMGPLSFAAARAPTTTVNLAVNFLRPVACPDTLRVEAEITGRGRKVMFLDAKVFDSRGRLVATGTSSVMILTGGPPS